MSEPLARRWVREPNRLHFPEYELVPEGKDHLELRTALYQVMKGAFAHRAWIGSDQFVYWDPTEPTACLSPDVFLKLGGPDDTFRVWKVWERGAPELAVEIVSPFDTRDPRLEDKLAKYRRLGVSELARFDPEAKNQRLRIWDNVEGDLVERVLAANTLPECAVLGLFWLVEEREQGPWLRLARDPEGHDVLPTPEEQAQRAQEEAASALERVRELEAELSRRR